MDDQTLLLTLIEAGLHQCRVAVNGQGGLLASLAAAGLVGGASHCAGMCGPFVLSQVAGRLEATPAAAMHEWHRLAGAALLPYHFGRATSYAALGAASALLAGSLIRRAGLHWLSAALLLLAAIVMLGMAVPAAKRLLAPWTAASGSTGDGWWSRFLGPWARPLFAHPIGWRGYLLGVLLGFLPCGLLYGALAAAAASGGPLAGAAAMLAFTAGTLPSLWAVGLVGHMAGQRWRTQLLRYAPLLLLVNAGVLTLLAWRQVA